MAAAVFTGPAVAWADDGSIVLDFIRHGESGDMTAINTMVPGPDLTPTGEQQASALALTLQHSGIDERTSRSRRLTR